MRSQTAFRPPPKEIKILETSELLGSGVTGDPYREIKRYWVKNRDNQYIEWFISDPTDKEYIPDFTTAIQKACEIINGKEN